MEKKSIFFQVLLLSDKAKRKELNRGTDKVLEYFFFILITKKEYVELNSNYKKY
jgi:hypothetical protein